MCWMLVKVAGGCHESSWMQLVARRVSRQEAHPQGVALC